MSLETNPCFEGSNGISHPLCNSPIALFAIVTTTCNDRGLILIHPSIVFRDRPFDCAELEWQFRESLWQLAVGQGRYLGISYKLLAAAEAAQVVPSPLRPIMTDPTSKGVPRCGPSLA